MNEPSRHYPISSRTFYFRLLRHAIAAILLLLCSLAIGMAGYQYFEHLSWLDAFLNSAMLLSGMGPVDIPKTSEGKIFAGFYALYSGVAFLTGVSLIVVPIMHRMMHLFQWKQDR